MSCDLELTKTEYDIVELTLRSGENVMKICGMTVSVSDLKVIRDRPPRDRYYATVRRILPERDY